MALAAFDFDGTIVRGDAGVHFARHLMLKGYLNAFDEGVVRGMFRVARLNVNSSLVLGKGALLHARYNRGTLDRHGMVARAYEMFKGLDATWISKEMRSYATNHLPGKLRGETVKRMREHAEQGDHVVVLSTGARDLIWPLRQALDLDFEVMACTLRDKEGVLTGRVEGPLNGHEKAMRLVAICKRRGHQMKSAWAYSDHEDDAAILELVGNPVVVKPTRAMKRIARERGWARLDQ